MAVPFEAPVKPGDLLADKYRVERVIGVGGMGVVVSAHHTQLEERVALKFLLPECLNNAEAVERFIREAKAAVRIRSEHIARIIDVGKLDNNAPYMVMEYLEGADLANVVTERGGLPPQEAVDYVLQACEAIAEAHALGIVHRDLKPSNLFLTTYADGSPLVKVLDFGISKLLETEGVKGLTSTSATMGSPVYMSPEQIRSTKTVDARSDIWSLGVILFELLSGKPPFGGDGATGVLASILMDAPIPLKQAAPHVSADLAAVVASCLEKAVDNRPATVADLAFALLPFAGRNAKLSVERIANVLHSGERIVVPSVAPKPSLSDIEVAPPWNAPISVGSEPVGVADPTMQLGGSIPLADPISAVNRPGFDPPSASQPRLAPPAPMPVNTIRTWSQEPGDDDDSRKLWLLGSVAGVAILLTGVVGFWLLSRNEPTDSPAVAAPTTSPSALWTTTAGDKEPLDAAMEAEAEASVAATAPLPPSRPPPRSTRPKSPPKGVEIGEEIDSRR
jgi:eukaryotic-like serine/threonine-protein kinase